MIVVLPVLYRKEPCRLCGERLHWHPHDYGGGIWVHSDDLVPCPPDARAQQRQVQQEARLALFRPHISPPTGYNPA